ncbi:SagB family peptide dehydrogenase [Bacillus massiliigorillae]|uniref:SagB family peptide dehydrogenase n=1 Tax=Bacillus massiliigorillae TaxID=1243664 RepID=UPI0003A13D7F|nr:SagB family peptide dehydrogenase [Bacillus massiliigorillae]
MILDEFLHNLHYHVDKLSPPNWEVDWDDAPLPYKLYQGLPSFPFSLEVPMTFEERNTSSTPDFESMGDFLWYVYGLTQLRESFFSAESLDEEGDLLRSFRRYAPSGGALYPNELYVYLKIEHLPTGIYHYDVAHHRLVLLREGEFDSYIEATLGNRVDMSECFGTVFISTMFWKNYYKYNNFAYRLQGMDTGVVIGQLLEIAKRFRFESCVYFQFLDRAVNHLLGLVENEESTYAVIPLSVQSANCFSVSNEKNVNITSEQLCNDLHEIHCNHYVHSQNIKEYPMLINMNEASMLEATESFRYMTLENSENEVYQQVSLPPVERLSYDLASVCRKRFSPEMDFVLGKVSKEQLSCLMYEAMESFKYQNDLGLLKQTSLTIYSCLYNVDDVPSGAYRYDSSTHALQPRQLGDQRLRLQQGMTISNVNMQQIPMCIHVGGEKEHYKESFGYRGYRIQQMEAGMLVQRLLLVASALGMGGHPLLGYDVDLCDELYRVKTEGITSLIQVPIGFYRNRPWLKGRLSS